MTPPHGASDEHGHNVEPSLVTSRVDETRIKRKKDPTILEAFFFLLFFSFSSAVTRAFPSPIKGEAGHPIRGIQICMKPDHEINTQGHNTST